MLHSSLAWVTSQTEEIPVCLLVSCSLPALFQPTLPELSVSSSLIYFTLKQVTVHLHGWIGNEDDGVASSSKGKDARALNPSAPFWEEGLRSPICLISMLWMYRIKMQTAYCGRRASPGFWALSTPHCHNACSLLPTPWCPAASACFPPPLGMSSVVFPQTSPCSSCIQPQSLQLPLLTRLPCTWCELISAEQVPVIPAALPAQPAWASPPTQPPMDPVRSQHHSALRSSVKRR